MSANRRYLIKCYFNDGEAINKSFGLFDSLRNFSPQQKKEYNITNIIVSPIRCFIDFEGGDLLVLYFNKFAFYTDSLDSIKSVFNGTHSYVTINGRSATIGSVFFSDVKYNVINNHQQNKNLNV